MYLAGYNYHTRNGQAHSRDRFLLLVQPNKYDSRKMPNPRAIVRTVSLKQCGHFMMGKARIQGETYVVSGTFGNDGLPMDVPEEVYRNATVIPDDVLNPYWKGSDPEEGYTGMYEWARKEFKK